jgi:hypothetical protein
MTNWHYKKLNELSFAELKQLKDLIYTLPEDLVISINDQEGEVDIDDYIESRSEEFFDVSDEDYKNLVGKCFINRDKNIALKVIGLSEDYSYEFLYEQYELSSYDKTWHNKDYIWLQEASSDCRRDFEKYRISSQTEMNIASEEMYHLGKDGKLYVDISCGGDYDEFGPLSSVNFELIREEAINNDGYYKIIS